MSIQSVVMCCWKSLLSLFTLLSTWNGADAAFNWNRMLLSSGTGEASSNQVHLLMIWFYQWLSGWYPRTVGKQYGDAPWPLFHLGRNLNPAWAITVRSYDRWLSDCCTNGEFTKRCGRRSPSIALEMPSCKERLAGWHGVLRWTSYIDLVLCRSIMFLCMPEQGGGSKLIPGTELCNQGEFILSRKRYDWCVIHLESQMLPNM